MNNVFLLIGYILLTVACIAVYAALIVLVYPRLCVRWDVSKRGDRGIKKYTFEGGRSVVFEPEIKIRKYIKQYSLSCIDDDKYIKCRIDDKIRYIAFDVVVYNNQNKIIDVMEISERIATPGYTRSVILPVDTAYVSVILRYADKDYTDTSRLIRYGKKGMLIYAALTFVTTFIQSRIMLALAARIWDCLFNIRVYPDNGEITVRALIIGAVAAAVILLAYYRRSVKEINR